MPIGLVQKLFQPSIFDQLLQMVLESSIVLGGMSLLMVVLAMETLVALYGVSSHLVWSFEVLLIFDFV